VQGALERQKVDATLMRYLGTVINVTLNILLVIGILGYFGIQTTTFAALFAAAGVAIGLAWSGLLANFAGGVFLIILRPLKVGDFVTVAASPARSRRSACSPRRSTRRTTCSPGRQQQDLLGHHPELLDQPLPAGGSEGTAVRGGRSCGGNGTAQGENRARSQRAGDPAGGCRDSRIQSRRPVLAVRPYCHTDHYWQVYFDTNRTIREALGAAGFPAPMPAQVVFVNQQ
jgi:small conductance mechanosensitive channel